MGTESGTFSRKIPLFGNWVYQLSRNSEELCHALFQIYLLCIYDTEINFDRNILYSLYWVLISAQRCNVIMSTNVYQCQCHFQHRQRNTAIKSKSFALIDMYYTVWSTFDITDHMRASNTLYFWSSNTDGGVIYDRYVFASSGIALPNEPVEQNQVFARGLTC